MAIIERIVIGFVKGMGGPDLDEWIDDLPKKAGVTIGDIVRRHRDVDGRLNAEGEKELEKILHADISITTDAMSVILEKEANINATDSVLPSYLEVLNTVVKIMRDIKRPIVLRGFLHSHDCLTYWYYDLGDFSKIKEYKIHPSVEVIMLSSGPKICILDSTNIDEDLQRLNLEIRTSQLHKLDYKIYSAGKEVGDIREFTIGLDGYGNDDLQIPFGAPGLVSLISSIPDALSFQSMPSKEVEKTIKKLKEVSSVKQQGA
jgi:hypothetical protein